MSQIITHADLLKLVDGLLSSGTKVIAPKLVKPGTVLYESLTAGTEWVPNGTDVVRPGNSLKEVVFPKHEKIYGYTLEGKTIGMTDAVLDDTPQVVMGAAPCDAASLAILDAVFHWDYQDEFFDHHKARTTVVTLACQKADGHCFCTSVGGSPKDERGSDAMLFDLGDGRYEVRCLTEKGKSLFAGKTTEGNAKPTEFAGPEKTFDVEKIRQFLETGFADSIWQEVSLRCIGCGTCAYLCPTCHCFDIVDERATRTTGNRVKNWDSCQFGLFTQHASGHNPRADQGQRQRQRILHKFMIYPDKFGSFLCTGCGNCSRRCPVGLGVKPVLAAITAKLK
ncbi:MAG: 4Fe-4S dicluster domain-containing protein [Thermoguttaceae bacterium]|nr:4Fe-4S dicluster domain-containing protein [Thermoguttaceae bacterium]